MPREKILHLYEYNHQIESIALKHLVQISLYDILNIKTSFDKSF
jgi:hypothetical protein